MADQTTFDKVCDELAEHRGFNIDLMPHTQREALEDEVRLVLRVFTRHQPNGGAGVDPPDTLQYAKHLCMWMHAQFYPDGSPEFGTLDTVAGILMQIDNMATGLLRAPEAGAEDARDGMVLVPREPTEAMIEAICTEHGSGGWPQGYGRYAQHIRREQAAEGYRAMIDAAMSDQNKGEG